jgi:tetratricopeptide (TPR) repeat protein
MAVAHEGREQPVEAVHLWQDALAIVNQLAAEYPLIEDFQANLAAGYHCLGRVSVDAHHSEEAVGYYQQALAIRGKLVRANPRSIKYCGDQGGTWYRLARALEQLGRREDTLAAYQQASNQCRLVCDLEPRIAKHWQALSERYGDIGRLQRELGRPADAAATCLQRKAQWPGNPVELCRMAVELALCAAIVGKNEATLSAEEQVERLHYISQTLQALHEAIHAAPSYFWRYFPT